MWFHAIIEPRNLHCTPMVTDPEHYWGKSPTASNTQISQCSQTKLSQTYFFLGHWKKFHVSPRINWTYNSKEILKSNLNKIFVSKPWRIEKIIMYRRNMIGGQTEVPFQKEDLECPACRTLTYASKHVLHQSCIFHIYLHLRFSLFIPTHPLAWNALSATITEVSWNSSMCE